MGRRISATPQSQGDSPVRGHEHRDISFKLVLFLVAIIFVAAFVIHGALWGWLSGLPRGTHQRYGSQWQVISPQAPQGSVAALQVEPQQDLETFQRQHQKRLGSYGWINPQAGVIQLPIQRAMQLIIEQGVPQWQPSAARFQFTGAATNAAADIDSAFLKKMAQASLAAIDLGRLGASNAQSSRLSDAGHKMVQEHQKLLKQIRDAAGAIQADLPPAPDLKDQLAEQQLRQKQGKDFDKSLARQLLADNAESLEDLHDATNKLQNAQVKSLASHLEEKLETEMQDIRDAAKSVGVSEASIEAIIQKERAAVGVAESPGGQEHDHAKAESSGQEDTAQPQDQSSTNSNESTGEPAKQQQNSSAKIGLDAAFLTHLAQAGIAEEQLGQLGAQRAQNQKLADLSRKLVQDHSRTELKLASAAHDLSLTLPKEASLKDQLALKQLRQQSRPNFDQAFARQVLSDEAGLLQEIQNAKSKLHDSEVKDLASETSDDVKKHLEDAKKAAKAAGLKPQAIEQLVVNQLTAAGAPFPLMAGVENSSDQQQPSQESQPEQGGAGSASSPGGQHTARESGTAPGSVSGENEITNQIDDQFQALGGADLGGDESQTGAGHSTQEKSPSSEGEQKDGLGQGRGSTNSQPTQAPSPDTSKKGSSAAGPSPLQLQQQRPGQSKNQQ